MQPRANMRHVSKQIDRDDLPAVEQIMGTRLYRCVYKTENVSQYISDLKVFGQIDFLHAFRHISLSMLQRARQLPVYEGRFTVPVLSPEYIIGLKIQALSNDPSRERLDAAGHNTSLDLYIRFLAEANAFANHAHKPFRRILDSHMKI